ncbi:MAG: substrate-binding domain-containing protein [Desulforhopalus sp.]
MQDAMSPGDQEDMKRTAQFNVLMQMLLLCFITTLYLTGTASGGNDKTIALVMKSLSNPFFSKMEEGARLFALEQKISLEVFGVDRETDVGHQISIVENLIARGYPAIVLAPADSKRLIPVCKKALDKGIVIINIDNPLHKPTLEQLGITIPFIGADNAEGGRKVGTYIKRKLNGKGRVLVIEGIRGAENSELRKQGFVKAVKADSAIEVISSESANWHTDEALSITTKLLNKYTDADAIFCANDAMALGALQAIDLLGISRKIILAGYDNIESVREEMRAGRIHATIEQHPEIIGELGVEAAIQKINGIALSLHKNTPLDLVTYEHFDKKIVFSVSSLDNSFFAIMERGVREAADLFGLELVVLDAQNQDTRQLTDIAGVLSTDLDLLILNPASTDSIYPGIELANNNHIPVITVDRKTSAGEVLCHIESDNTDGGRMAARFIAERLGDRGVVLELEGIPGTSAAHERGEGFNEELLKHDKINVEYREVANFSREEAREVTLQFLEQKKRVDGVFAHNDNMILGLIDAFETSGVALPKVLVGFDAIPDARKSIKSGQLTATIAQQPRTIGKLAVSTAARYFRGEDIASKILFELSMVTK